MTGKDLKISLDIIKLFQRVNHFRRASRGKVGSPHPETEKGIAGKKRVAAFIAYTADGMARRVNHLKGKLAQGNFVPVVAKNVGRNRVLLKPVALGERKSRA